MKKRLKRTGFKALAFLLSFLMVFYVLPSSVYAELFDSDEKQNGSEERNAAIKEVFELVDRREESVKHFRLEDGSIMAVQYAEAVHRADENGVWQDIDNRLSAQGSDIGTSDARVKFAKKITGNETLFTLHHHNQKITMSLNGARKKTAGTVTNTSTDLGDHATQLQKLMTLDKLSAKILYADILDGVDLEYVIVSNDIKENIIVKERKDSYTYTFTVKLNNLDAELNEDGSVVIFEPGTKETVYYIPAPIVYDANGVSAGAEDAYYTLSASGNSYTLTVTANTSWMNDASRAFPVTIDPPIYSGDASSIIDLDISTANVDHSSPDDPTVYVDSVWRAYWKYTTLPSIPASAYISDAKMTLTSSLNDESVKAYIAVYDVLSDWDDSLTWREVTENSIGRPAEDYTDFQELRIYEDSARFQTFSWNVTPIVKKWYSGQNYGMMFAPATDTVISGTAKFYSNDYSDTAKRPKLCIQYRDMKGIESYWSYSSQSAGFAGSGAVHHATGNLVFSIPTLTSTDALIPYTPTLTYNSALAGKAYQYPNAQVAYTGTDTAYGFKHNMCETLIKKNYVDQTGAQKFIFVWADGDGTEHYFLPTATAGTYVDEDGLLLTLVEESSYCTLTDTSHTVKTFKKLSSQPADTISGWYLESITDNNGNKLLFEFESGQRPISIKLIPKGSIAIEQLKMAYDSNSKLYIVWNPTSNEAVMFRYSSTPSGAISTSGGNYLRQVVRLHGTGTVTAAEWRSFYDSNSNTSTTKIKVDAIAEYKYNAAGQLLSVSNLLSKYRIQYFISEGKVIRIKEWALGDTNTAGQLVTIAYGTSNTVITTSGKDDQMSTSDDLKTTYFFDQEGRTVGCYTTDSTYTQIYGASYGQYADEKDTAAKNSLKSTIQATQASSNYLLNYNFADAASGNAPHWNTSGSVTFGSGYSYDEQTKARLTVGKTVPASSISQTVLLSEGDYTFSFFVSTIDAQGLTASVRITSALDASHSVVEQIPVNEYSAVSPYAFFSLKFHAQPETYTEKESFTISIELQGTPDVNKNLGIANPMLAKTTGAAEYDLLQMGHFEPSSTSNQPGNYWKILDRENDPLTIYESADQAFGHVLEINSPLGECEYVQQTVTFATALMKAQYENSVGNQYPDPILFTLSGWGKGTAQTYANTSSFGFDVDLIYYQSNGSTASETYHFSFDKGVTDWQYLSAGFASNPAKGLLDSIVITIAYIDNPGVGYFDNISLVMDSNSNSNYSYNEKGFLTSAQTGRNSAQYQYDSNDDLVKVVTSSRFIISYTYANHRLMIEERKKYTQKEEDATLISDILYSYNSYGQCESVAIIDAETLQSTKQSTVYDTTPGSHTFGIVIQEVDALNSVTKYFYNESNGRLLAVILPNGNGTSYEYDAIGNLKQVLPAVLESDSGYFIDYSSASVAYGYDSATNRLSTITTESTVYRFTYDVFGNSETISVGNQTLVDHDYNANNGKPNTLTYGNGLKVKYVYDTLDRISEIQYNIGSGGAFETVYSYTYDAAGNLCVIADHVSKETTLYKYDLEGKLLQSYVYDTETFKNLYGSYITYDEQSRISNISFKLDYACTATGSYGTTYSETLYSRYNYDDNTGNLNSYRLSGSNMSGTIKPTYDNLDRVSQRIINFRVNDIDAFYQKQDYTYRNSGSGYVSGLISQIESEIRQGESGSTLSSTTYKYTYDGNGNITAIIENGTVQCRYEYDDLGQLVREDNRAKGVSYIYHYDNAGNLTAKKEYAFTTGTLGAVKTTKTYTYGNSNWGDLLTNFNGNKIEYDEIGNPIKIGDYDEASDIWWSGYILKWEGRQLISRQYFEYTDDEEYYYNTPDLYTYNADGIRTSQTILGVTHYYILDGSQIIGETWEDAGWSSDGEEFLLLYLYDENGSPIGMKYRTNKYAAETFDYFFFETNPQGDVIGIYNANGKWIGGYTYDAWGNMTLRRGSNCTELENLVVSFYNPFRYRGYYHDYETGFYYLQTRYYNPEWGRFLNADGYINANGDLLGFNMFAYCGNNPVMGYDPTGEWNWGTFFSGVNLLMVGATAIAAAATILTCGAAAPLMVAVAATTLVAGTATVVNGIAEVVEAGTDYNFVRDGIMDGNEEAYNTYKNVTKTVSEIGATICTFYYAANAGNVCFAAGTLIATEAGLVPIEDIQPGDLVWATNPETGETELKPVVQLFRNETDEWVHVTVNGEEIVCTSEHPFYSPVKGWTAACQLRAGDILVLLNGEYVVVEQVQHEILENPETTYNFEVDDFHTYYVGKESVLVHNLCTSTGSNYRSNAKRFYETDGVGQQAHHIFPQKFEAYFNSKGMNIHSPQNITFMDKTIHLKGSAAYNKLWASFISENPNASYNAIRIAGQMFMKMVF